MLIFISACQSKIINDCPDGLTKFSKVSLYFGTSTNEGIITNEEWSNFCHTIDQIYQSTKFIDDGHVADYIPQLKNMDGNKFTVSIF